MTHQDSSQESCQEDEESQMLGGYGDKTDGPRTLKALTKRPSACLPILQMILIIIQIILLGWHSIIILNQPKYLEQSRPIRTTYGNDKYYMTLDHDYDFLWEDKAVLKAGVIPLSKNHEGKTTEYGAITMFHQLHCLASFRKALQEARESHHVHVAVDWSEDPHWPHCLYYLRQTLLCVADGQIEQQQMWNSTSLFIDGTGDFRQCNDHKPLFDLFDEKNS